MMADTRLIGAIGAWVDIATPIVGMRLRITGASYNRGITLSALAVLIDVVGSEPFGWSEEPLYVDMPIDSYSFGPF